MPEGHDHPRQNDARGGIGLQVAVGCDHAGVELKDEIKARLAEQGVSILDVGTWSSAESVDYPEFGQLVADWVAGGQDRAGILVCGTGTGMCMVANRVAGVRAAVCHDPWSAAMARAHNDANVLCLGARVVGAGLALAAVRSFLETGFTGDRHARRVDMIRRMDSERGPAG